MKYTIKNPIAAVATAGAAAFMSLTPIATAQLPSISAGAYASICHVDDEIDQGERKQAEDVALALAQSVIGGDAPQTYTLMSKESQSAAPMANVEKLVGIIKASGPFKSVRVSHSYMIDLKTAGSQLPPMVCGKTLDDPDRVTVSMRSVPKQFHVEIAANSINNGWSIFIWLIPEDGTLKALSFSFNLTAISGKTSRDLQRLAQEQSAQGHAFNAAFLYQAAESTSSRGPNALTAWKQDLDKEIRAFVVPKDLAGPPPHMWHVGDQTFDIQGGGVIGLGGDLDLILDRRLTNWTDGTAADSDNKNFVTALVKAYPELGASFKAIAAKAEKPDGTGGFTTVYEFGKGFAESR